MNKPTVFTMFQTLPDQTGSMPLAFNPRWFSTGSVSKLADGRILETSTNTRGCWIYALWDSLDDFLAHESYKYPNVVLEQF